MKTDPQLPTKSASSQQSSGFFNGILVGTALGAGAYYLFGTEQGKKLKSQLLEAARVYGPQLQETIISMAEEGVQQVKNIPEVKQALDTLEEKASHVSQAVVAVEEQLPPLQEEVKAELKQLEESIAEAKKKADEMQQNLEQAASKIEKKFFVRKGRSLKK